MTSSAGTTARVAASTCGVVRTGPRRRSPMMNASSGSRRGWISSAIRTGAGSRIR